MTDQKLDSIIDAGGAVQASAAAAASTEWREHAYPLQQITIKLQGTRRSDRAAILQQLDGIAARLRAGELSGKEDDDDFGYVFHVDAEGNGRSFLNDAHQASPAVSRVDELVDEGKDLLGAAAYAGRQRKRWIVVFFAIPIIVIATLMAAMYSLTHSLQPQYGSDVHGSADMEAPPLDRAVDARS